MWVPGSVTEIRRAITDGLEESPWLDAKRELSTTAEAAKDVAAMANDGGVLLYGVGEDDEGKLSEVVPIEDLTRVEERLCNAVRDLIHNPPAIHVSPLEDSPGSRTGCLVVVVPRSPLAPHMVEGRRGGRYYGRVGTTTHQLTGAQVEQLLTRRSSSLRNATEALDQAAPWRWEQPEVDDDDVGGLVVLVEPVVPSGALVARAAGDAPVVSYLPRAIGEASASVGNEEAREVAEAAREGYWQIGVDRYITVPVQRGLPSQYRIEVEAGRDGQLVLRSRGAVVRMSFAPSQDQREPWCNEWRILGRVEAALVCAGRLFRESGEVGQVRCSVRVDGLLGARSMILENARLTGRPRIVLSEQPRMFEDVYQRHVESLAPELLDHRRNVARLLLTDLFEALAQGAYPDGTDPLATEGPG